MSDSSQPFDLARVVPQEQLGATKQIKAQPALFAPTGIVADLATMPEKALITQTALAKILKKNTRTIRRMVARGELPPPIPFGGESTWIVGRLLAHIDARAVTAAEEAERHDRRIRRLSGDGV